MPRTPEQVAADDTLTEAIEQVHRAYQDEGGGPVEGVLTEYDSGVPIPHLLGLCEYASTRYRKAIATD